MASNELASISSERATFVIGRSGKAAQSGDESPHSKVTISDPFNAGDLIAKVCGQGYSAIALIPRSLQSRFESQLMFDLISLFFELVFELIFAIVVRIPQFFFHVLTKTCHRIARLAKSFRKPV